MGISSKLSVALLGGALLSLPLTAQADTQDTSARLAALEARLAAQDAELASLRGQKSESWLNERRAEEVKALVRDVLADADTRASFQGSGTNAGYKNGFFIASEDGKFTLRTNVLGQIRYVYSDSKNTGGAIGVSPTPAGGDETTNGFSLRNYRLDFRGNAITPNLTYRLRLTGGPSSNGITYDHAYIGYKIADGLNLTVGNFKPKFLREENVSGYRQLAAERSFTSDFFTVDYTQGAELSYDLNDKIRLSAAFHDGSYAGSTEFNADRTDFAFVGRAEFLVKGKWNQFNDFTSWSKDDFGLLIGVGAGYEKGEGATTNPDVFKYTADISAEVKGLTLFAAIQGQTLHSNYTGPGNTVAEYRNANQLGIVVQAGYHVIPDKLEVFGRYEWIDFDGVYHRAGSTTNTGNPSKLDTLSIATIGANYYLSKHNAKFTGQALYAFDPVPANSAGSGALVASPRSGQLALVGQFQFEF